jgi:hypothetical protein
VAEDVLADGDRMAVRFTSRGTNLGEFLGSPPTGNRVEISEVAIFRLSDGEIVEQWVYPDMRSLQRQLSGGSGAVARTARDEPKRAGGVGLLGCSGSGRGRAGCGAGRATSQ